MLGCFTCRQVAIVVEPFKNGIMTSGIQQKKKAPEEPVRDRRCVPHVKVERLKIEAKVILGLIVQTCTAVVAEASFNRPIDQIADDDEIRVNVQSDGIVESHIFAVERASFDHANA